MKKQVSKFDKYVARNFGYGTRTFTTKELILFSEKLLAQIKKHVTIPEALETIFQTTGERTLRMMLMSMATNVQAGTSLSQSMLTFQDVFPNYYIAAIMAAERSGKFVKGLESLIILLKNEKTNQEYQGLISLYARMVFYNLIIAVIIILVQFKIINFSVNSVLLTIVSLVSITLFSSILYRFFTDEKQRYTAEKLIVKIPIIGKLYIYNKISRFCYMFDVFQQAGLPFLQNVELLGNYMDCNICYHDLININNGLRAKSSVQSVLDSLEYFPEMLAKELFLYQAGDSKVDSIRNYSNYVSDEIRENSVLLISGLKSVFIWSSIIILGWIYFLIILKL
ncbi:MAG: type II secretion system F family protein [Candidatus Neomarinimicrobiota bacterium]